MKFKICNFKIADIIYGKYRYKLHKDHEVGHNLRQIEGVIIILTNCFK